MGAELIPMAFTTGWGSGINAYAVVLVLGLADKIFNLSQIPNALARTDVLIGAGVLFVVEMLADKIPYVDSAWDSVHTVVRPAVGATIGYLIGHDTATLDAAVGAATGGVTALISHGIKAGLRAAVNTSPEPASNVLVSTTEDVTVTGVTALAIAHPWWAAAIALLFLVLGAFFVYKLAGRIRRYKRRYDAWGERVGIAVPSERREHREHREHRGRRGTAAPPPTSARTDERLERPFDQET
ncbi:DUF4126 domain-containing protein [Terrabacter sp. Ter38]|uniref:DUF4126 domain-containing protein n=1 Tax=Terrabacter sp. Ter38 TaxID=2926030 RepID=UPI0021177DC8|nr:DUF4126 domain-containing protein [Terrabacter sp. Ter38]